MIFRKSQPNIPSRIYVLYLCIYSYGLVTATQIIANLIKLNIPAVKVENKNVIRGELSGGERSYGPVEGALMNEREGSNQREKERDRERKKRVKVLIY